MTGSGRPVIGLSTYRVDAQWGVWDGEAVLLPTTYTRSIEAAGGIAMLLPPPSEGLPAAEFADTAVSRIDGLVITGGSDVDPSRYGAERHRETDEPHGQRDVWELALLDAAAAVSLPTLGICRGVQVMAVHGGGTLHQHVPEVVGHSAHSPGGRVYGEVAVSIEPGSRLASLVSASTVGDRLTVSCHHHQAVATHPGFRATAWSADGVLEAMEADGSADRFNLGIQWHPEERDDAGLFGGLVRACTPSG
ncbi:gamma-glutamyl-gamma-aminobutyrate hydrolase family protein [Microlunatus soli]|uniref:Putative glutamine amidotransferase n=1 Tax=Microlunatus soli TaxID=630515 RepID=A0A1H1XAC5_9ACTN|nr:gamma-glutamyl-gamma-aminobutyrate hydrolase family protein [Microlunatus soli]SDT06257.1 putative glutamine amidotransferase [Microlunatus soli]